MLDNLGKATNGKRNWRHSERHGVYHTGAEAFGARRMQEDIEAGNGRHDVVYKPGRKSSHSTNFDWTVRIAPKKKQRRVRPRGGFELTGNRREIWRRLFPRSSRRPRRR
jgi:hypothetical protein